MCYGCAMCMPCVPNTYVFRRGRAPRHGFAMDVVANVCHGSAMVMCWAGRGCAVGPPWACNGGCAVGVRRFGHGRLWANAAHPPRMCYVYA